MRRRVFEEARAVFQSLGGGKRGQVVGNLGRWPTPRQAGSGVRILRGGAIQLLESVGEHDPAQATYTALSRPLKQGNWSARSAPC
jgi:hypothetical protein